MREMWIDSESVAKYVIIMFLLCDCRNIWQLNDMIKEYITEMNQRPIVPAISAMHSSWPKAFKIRLAKRNIGITRVVVTTKTSHDS